MNELKNERTNETLIQFENFSLFCRNLQKWFLKCRSLQKRDDDLWDKKLIYLKTKITEAESKCER